MMTIMENFSDTRMRNAPVTEKTYLEMPALPDSQVRRFRNTKPPTASSRTPLKTSTVCKMATKLLIKAQEAADAERRDEKRDRETGGIDRQQKNSLPDRVARGRDREHAGENRADAGRPAEGEGETHQEAARGSGLSAEILETNVAIEPARERRTEQKNQGDGDEVYGLQPRAEKACTEAERDSSSDERDTDEQSCAHGNFREQAGEVQAEEDDQRAGDGRERGAIAQEEGADGAGGCAEGNEDDGKSGDECEGRGEQAGAGRFAFFQLLDADAGEHGNVAGHQRKDAWGEKRD